MRDNDKTHLLGKKAQFYSKRAVRRKSEALQNSRTIIYVVIDSFEESKPFRMKMVTPSSEQSHLSKKTHHVATDKTNDR